MKTYFIICCNPALTATLSAWLLHNSIAENRKILSKSVGEAPRTSNVSDEFQFLVNWIESNLPLDNIDTADEVTVLTDLCGYGNFALSELNPVEHQEWKTVLGMLVLGFPEIRWLFLSGKLDDNSKMVSSLLLSGNQNLLLENVTAYGKFLSPLFDALGLRNAIPIINPKDANNKNNSPCRRIEFSVAIDDEKSYAWFHAYTAYRFGFRAQVVSTSAGMETTLSEINYPKPMLVFEDYFLQFGDIHHEGFSHLRTRDHSYPQLKQAKYRILITSGHHHGQDKEASEDNPVYLRELRAKGLWNKVLNKQLGGIFNLWKDSGLQHKLQKEKAGRRGLAPGYHWPPNPKKLDDDKSGHSAPGRLLVIADRLIARAERLLSNGVHSVPQAVYGAVLATDALELLGGKTPTTSLEALALKHQFEVLAECQFVGMQQHMDVEARMKDIQLEIKSLCYWFGTKRQQKNVAGWNAELAILNKLIAVFKEQNQFDEEQALLVRTRVLHRKLRFSKYPFIFKPLEIFPWYVEKLVASFRIFLFAIVAWLSAASVAWWLIEGKENWQLAISGVWSAFFSGTAATSSSWPLINLSCVIIASGFLHLGVLVAYIYSLISRR